MARVRAASGGDIAPPLQITQLAFAEAIRHCVERRPDEACGFIVGRGGLGTRVITMPNAAENPEVEYVMPDDIVVDTVHYLDDTGEEIIAVYHSHPASEPIPSEGDKAAPDHTPAYLIVSLMGEQPESRAWRLDVEYVGVIRAIEVELRVVEHEEDAKPSIPWSLMIGNIVQLTYRRNYGVNQQRTFIAEITGYGENYQSVNLKSNKGINPRTMMISRIREVEVLTESPSAKKLRNRMGTTLRVMAQMVAAGDVERVPALAETVLAAFPPDIRHYRTERKSL